MENFRLPTAQVKLHQICTLIGYFPESMEELCLRIPESHSVHPPPSLLFDRGVEPPTKFQKGGGLDRTSTFTEGLLGKRGMTFFQGEGEGCNFYIKNKLRFEIFNDKKVYKQKYFSLS